MVINTASHVTHPRYKEENHLAVRATAKRKNQEAPIVSGRTITKWFGALTTALICAAALAPNAFGIPIDLHPWLFLASIFWFFALCAGLFDL
jgi:hypothetical protein